jgi:hypothetical protein
MFNGPLTPPIIYEVLEEHADGTTLSRLFCERNVQKSRQLALQHFLRLYFEEMDDVLLTVYVRHLPSHQRVELINNSSYGCFWECARSLEKELSFYENHRLATFIAIINAENEDVVEIYWPRTKFHHLWKTRIHTFMLAADYWIFTQGRKKEEFVPY